jgi:hypothetical protein
MAHSTQDPGGKLRKSSPGLVSSDHDLRSMQHGPSPTWIKCMNLFEDALPTHYRRRRAHDGGNLTHPQ